jgi:hypothetical protein
MLAANSCSDTAELRAHTRQIRGLVLCTVWRAGVGELDGTQEVWQAARAAATSNAGNMKLHPTSIQYSNLKTATTFEKGTCGAGTPSPGPHKESLQGASVSGSCNTQADKRSHVSNAW